MRKNSYEQKIKKFKNLVLTDDSKKNSRHYGFRQNWDMNDIWQNDITVNGCVSASKLG